MAPNYRDYVEMFRGTIDSTSVYPREDVKETLKLNAAEVTFSHAHPGCMQNRARRIGR